MTKKVATWCNFRILIQISKKICSVHVWATKQQRVWTHCNHYDTYWSFISGYYVAIAYMPPKPYDWNRLEDLGHLQAERFLTRAFDPTGFPGLPYITMRKVTSPIPKRLFWTMLTWTHWWNWLGNITKWYYLDTRYWWVLDIGIIVVILPKQKHAQRDIYILNWNHHLKQKAETMGRAQQTRHQLLGEHQMVKVPLNIWLLMFWAALYNQNLPSGKLS